jgi:hypothetical protein
MKIVRFHNGREAEVPDTYAEGFDMLVKTMNAYHDRRGGNLERLSCAARVAYGLFGKRFMAPDPTIALVYLMQKICESKGVAVEDLK